MRGKVGKSESDTFNGALPIVIGAAVTAATFVPKKQRNLEWQSKGFVAIADKDNFFHERVLASQI